jgi:hypothetical protein
MEISRGLRPQLISGVPSGRCSELLFLEGCSIFETKSFLSMPPLSYYSPVFDRLFSLTGSNIAIALHQSHETRTIIQAHFPIYSLDDYRRPLRRARLFDSTT